MPLTSEGLWVLTLDARSDDTSTRRDLGVQPRPLDETLADTVRWMARNGVISDKQAGLLGI
jgi:nucleoside-diphosphate-sugar epimerase